MAREVEMLASCLGEMVVGNISPVFGEPGLEASVRFPNVLHLTFFATKAISFTVKWFVDGDGLV